MLLLSYVCRCFSWSNKTMNTFRNKKKYKLINFNNKVSNNFAIGSLNWKHDTVTSYKLVFKLKAQRITKDMDIITKFVSTL